MKTSTDELRHIHELIDRYFNAETSEAEELRLKKILATTSYSSPEIDEAKAVFGYFAMSRGKHNVDKHRSPATVRAAATIAISLICGIALFFGNKNEENLCEAYIGEETITDNNIVMSMMQNDLNIISEACSNLQTDLDNQFSSLANELSF